MLTSPISLLCLTTKFLTLLLIFFALYFLPLFTPPSRAILHLNPSIKAALIQVISHQLWKPSDPFQSLSSWLPSDTWPFFLQLPWCSPLNFPHFPEFFFPVVCAHLPLVKGSFPSHSAYSAGPRSQADITKNESSIFSMTSGMARDCVPRTVLFMKCSYDQALALLSHYRKFRA